jgi:nitrogen fixation/metabolism regulation signal transduction histidine kinase
MSTTRFLTLLSRVKVLYVPAVTFEWMRGSPTDSQRRMGRTHDTSRVRADGAGVGLFDVTVWPAIEYAAEDDTTVVRRVNQAFMDTFDITDEVAGIPLSTTMDSVTVAGDNYAPLVASTGAGEDAVVTCECETATGKTAFRVQVTPADGGGYVVFTETLADERLDVLKYLTHSLRNPLEVATVHTDVIADAEDPDHIDTVQTAHERMEAIIADTMELAQQGAVVEETAPVDIDALARAAWETVRTDAATLSVGTPPTVEGNEGRLRVLFENLFRNAIRHGTPDDGDGIVVTVDAMADGFYVADDGRGIPATDRDRVLDAGYTTDDDGTGLGLAIVAEIAERHGWSVAVTGSDAGGTRFDFTT